MTNSTNFNDPALAEIVQKCSPAFKTFQTNLDKTSSDIKALEKWLQGCGICVYASVRIDPCSEIAWSNETGDWRLVCESPPDDEEIDRSRTRPLIESPVRLRLLARPHLPTLVAQIAKLVPPAPAEPEKKKPLRLFSKASEATSSMDDDVELNDDFSTEEIPF